MEYTSEALDRIYSSLGKRVIFMNGPNNIFISDKGKIFPLSDSIPFIDLLDYRRKKIEGQGDDESAHHRFSEVYTYYIREAGDNFYLQNYYSRGHQYVGGYVNLEDLKWIFSDDVHSISFKEFLKYQFSDINFKSIDHYYDKFYQEQIRPIYQYFNWLVVPSSIYVLYLSYLVIFKNYNVTNHLVNAGIELLSVINDLKQGKDINFTLNTLKPIMIIIGMLFILVRLFGGFISWSMNTLRDLIKATIKLLSYYVVKKKAPDELRGIGNKIVYTLRFSKYVTFDSDGKETEHNEPIVVSYLFYKSEKEYIEKLLTFLKDRVSPSTTEQIQREIGKIDWYVNRTPNIDEKLKSL